MSQAKFKVRAEQAADELGIETVNRQAFHGRQEEARLVQAIRHSPDFIPELSIVAEQDGAIIGHVLFSPIYIQTADRQVPALSLAPVAVAPEFQDHGVGQAMIQAGLQACKKLGHTIVIVLGHSMYYPRFGFSAELAEPLECPFGDCGRAWMALELKPGALQGIRGRVVYPPAFREL